ncbi:hypothetical protein INR49_028091 [Caranx melampygus]|nr:hypothetical protein INR49_028091 [Caranx melampygus]
MSSSEVVTGGNQQNPGLSTAAVLSFPPAHFNVARPRHVRHVLMWLSGLCVASVASVSSASSSFAQYQNQNQI